MDGKLMLYGFLAMLIAWAILIYKFFAKNRKITSNAKMLSLYDNLKKVPILKNILQYIINDLSYTTVDKINICTVRAIKFFEKHLFWSTAMVIASLFIYDNVIYTIGVILFTLVWFRSDLNKEMNSDYNKLMKDMVRTIPAIGDKYKMNPVINDALNYAFHNNSTNYIVELVRDTISGETNKEYASVYIDEVVNIPLLRIFATICRIEDEVGELVVSVNGGFLRDLEILTYDVNHENLKALKIQNEFSGLIFVTCAPLLLRPLMHAFWCGNFVSINHMYFSWYGVFIDILFILSVCIVYYIISDNSLFFTKMSDNSLTNFTIKGTGSILLTTLEKLFCATEKKRKELKDKLDSVRYIGGISSYIIKKFTTTIATAIILAFIIISRYNAIVNYEVNSIDTFTVSSGMYTKEQQEQISAVDKIILNMTREEFEEIKLKTLDENYSGGLFYDRYKSDVDKIGEANASNEAYRIIKKYEKVHDFKIEWYVVVLYIGALFLAWYSQDIIIKFKAKEMKVKIQDEIFNIATMNVVLSNTAFNVDRCLRLIRDQVVLLKNNYIQAIEEFSQDAYYGLENLSESVDSSDFKVYIDKLKNAIYTLAISDAYNDAYDNKKRMQVEREEFTNTEIRRKGNLFKLLVFLPTGILILLGYLLPFLIVSISTLIETLNRLQIG